MKYRIDAGTLSIGSGTVGDVARLAGRVYNSSEIEEYFDAYSQAEIDEVLSMYTAEDRSSVSAFLREHSAVIPAAKECRRLVRELLGDVDIKLKVSVDPDSGSSTLMGHIQKRPFPENSMDMLLEIEDRVDELLKQPTVWMQFILTIY